MTVSVLLADDQAMVRGGLRLILENQPDIKVVAEASDGIEVTRALAGPGVPEPLRVVVVTTFDLDEYVYGALRGGAVGFVLKDAGPVLLAEAVRAARAGNALVSPSVTLRLLHHLAATGKPATRGFTRQLSERETEVVRAIAHGRTNKEIAAELFISLSTVKSHVSAIQAKLGARNRVQIAAWAWENRIVGNG